MYTLLRQVVNIMKVIVNGWICVHKAITFLNTDKYMYQEYCKVIFTSIFMLCFANLKVKVTKYRISSDRFEFSTHKLCKKQVDNKLYTYMPNKVQCFKF